MFEVDNNGTIILDAKKQRKFYMNENIVCLKPKVPSVRNKKDAFKQHFLELLEQEWDPKDCTPVKYTKYFDKNSGENKCICTQVITKCLQIKHAPTNQYFQVGCVCYENKTDGKDHELILQLKKEWEELEKERLRLLLPICIKCKQHKKVFENEACQSCQPRNGCLIMVYDEDIRPYY